MRTAKTRLYLMVHKRTFISDTGCLWDLVKSKMVGILEIWNAKNMAGFILKSVRRSKHSQIQDRLPSVLVSCINFSKEIQELSRIKKMHYVHLKIAQMVFLQLFNKQVTSESYCFQFALESIQQAAAPAQAVLPKAEELCFS